MFRRLDALFCLIFTTRGAGPITCAGRRRRSGRAGGDELESPIEKADDLDVPRARMKISVLTDISVLGFYGYIGYIGDISMDIFT